MGRPCDYTDGPPPAPTAEDLAVLQLRLVELEGRLNGAVTAAAASATEHSNSSGVEGPTPATVFTPPREQLWQGGVNQFPSVVFLDADAFGWLDMAVPKPTVQIPEVSVSDAVG
jgi:hypothetical protein